MNRSKKFTKKRYLKKKLKTTKKKRNHKMRGGMNDRNLLNSELKVCSKNPMTGYFRDGYCRTNEMDSGKHTVCGKMTPKFLEFSKSKGNDLTSVVKENDNWCLCEDRWLEAHKNNVKVEVIKESSNSNMNSDVKNIILKK